MRGRILPLSELAEVGMKEKFTLIKPFMKISTMPLKQELKLEFMFTAIIKMRIPQEKQQMKSIDF